MKNIRILFAGLIFVFGIPAGLLLSGMSIPRIFRDLETLRSLMDVELLIQRLVAGSLWIIWIYGLLNLIIEICRSLRYGFFPRNYGISNRVASKFVLAIWLLVSQSHGASQTQQIAHSEQQVQMVNDDFQSRITEVNELSISTNALALITLIALYEAKERRKMQLALAGMKVPVRGKSFQFNWATLKYRRQALSSNDTEFAFVTTESRYRACLIGPGAVVEHLADAGECDEVHAQIPIGMMGNKTLFVSVGEKTEIAVVGSSSESVADVCRYLRTFLKAAGLTKVIQSYDIDQGSGIQFKNVMNQWFLFPGEIEFTPFSISDQEESACSNINSEFEKEFERTERHDSIQDPGTWQICVRIMGPIEVVDSGWEVIQFEKSKSQELLAWLVLHRERPTRIAARTALWGIAVQDATFNNVVSGLRKATKSCAPNLLGRGSSESLVMNNAVTTDHEIMVNAIRSLREEMNERNIESLRNALELVRDLPFAGQDYFWADAEGVTSNVILDIITAALMLSEHYLAKNDIENVFWATGKGLQALRGHEPLIALRMKAHALNRNISGVNAEWQAYERIRIAEDNFYDRASNELSNLRDTLLSPS